MLLSLLLLFSWSGLGPDFELIFLAHEDYFSFPTINDIMGPPLCREGGATRIRRELPACLENTEIISPSSLSVSVSPVRESPSVWAWGRSSSRSAAAAAMPQVVGRARWLGTVLPFIGRGVSWERNTFIQILRY